MTDRDRLIYFVMQAEVEADKQGFCNCYVSKPKAECIVDYLLANGVIVPPCKVGDKVYLPCLNDWGDIENYTITEIVIDKDGFCFVVDDEDREAHSIEILGKEVFLTKQEAERELEKRCK